ncbi:DUF4367 domain-containing protein [Paenibacillus sonchi]|uniref:DUF4367 domain-containing protein n=1 Tax=Paenibacillus sonchi TaxID=373687 RepID=A0A974P8I3_9BACL|nr:DUF4367 domain-containing protein [Paenibacillus sonchi]QQZ58743.1 DUF4367 domain-containing protein [Paenibacillus sonchi]
MPESRLTLAEQRLKKYDNAVGAKTINVHASVMEVIEQKYGSLRDEHRMGKNGIVNDYMPDTMQKVGETVVVISPSKRSVLKKRGLAYAAPFLLLLSLAVGYLQDSQSEMKQKGDIHYTVIAYEPLVDPVSGFRFSMKEKPEGVPQEPLSTEEKIRNEKNKLAVAFLDKQLLPGEKASFVIRTKAAVNGEDVVFTHSVPFRYEDYPAYLSKQAEMATPMLEQPDYLPNGFSFKEGFFYPYSSGTANVDSSKKRVQKLDAFTARDLGDGYELKWKKGSEFNEQAYSILTYADGNQLVTIRADRVEGRRKIEHQRLGHSVVETIQMEGRKLLYTKSASNSWWDYRHSLYWLEPKSGTYYSLSDNRNSKLSKEEMLKIAASMFK